MGNQLIILGCVGSFNPQLTSELVKFLGERGLEIQHASNRYDGQTHFAVGTGADLAAAFESAAIKTAFVEVHAPDTQPITLQTVLDAVNEGRKENQTFFKYEKRDDKKRGAKSLIEPEKKKGLPTPAEDPTTELPRENEAPQVLTPPTAPDAATPQEGDPGASAMTAPPEDGAPHADEQTQESQTSEALA